ncbi:MAG: hypothetical protein ICV66_11450, partial [Chitinophagaceae bacterium]|nr:hypothetical protein [Chitinophagaceae bacterium]
MRKFTLFLLVGIAAIKARTQPGSLDKTFGVNGIVKTEYAEKTNAGWETPHRVLLQKDGKILIIFEFNGKMIVTRRLSNGQIDVSYGDQGFSEPIDLKERYKAAIQDDGKIVAAGASDYAFSAGAHFKVVRINTDGSLDQTFANTGVITTNLGYQADIPTDVAIQKDGKILVTGISSSPGAGGVFSLVRYNPNGTLDNTFNGTGILTTSLNG